MQSLAHCVACGVSSDQLAAAFRRFEVRPVLTAHPTEAVRRSILDHQDRIGQELARLRAPLSSDEGDRVRQRIATQVEILWHTDEVRSVRPRVLDEVGNAIFYLERTFFDGIPEIERQLEQGKENIKQRVAVEYGDSLHREAMLKKAVAETKTEFDKINAHSFDYQNLKREAEADRKLYEELITKIKEAGINSGFQSSAVRIADLARAAIKPVFPDIPLNLALALSQAGQQVGLLDADLYGPDIPVMMGITRRIPGRAVTLAQRGAAKVENRQYPLRRSSYFR